METSILSHLTNSALVVYALQWAKGTARYQRFAAWVPIADAKVHMLVSMLGAAGAAIGMHGAVTGNASDGWKLALAIPPLWVVCHAAWDTAQQFALNQILFTATVQQKAAAPVVSVPVAPHSEVVVTAPLPKE